MRRALFLAALAACAHGSTGAAVDAHDGSGSNTTPDAPTCNGLPCTAIYVAPTGNDSADGSMATPVKTITAGIAKASAASPKAAVFVQAGTYAEAVAMKPGVGVYGGFDTSWTRGGSAITTIGGASPEITFDQIVDATVL